MILFWLRVFSILAFITTSALGKDDEEGSANSETTTSNSGGGSGLSSGDIALICIFVPIGTVLLGVGFYQASKYYKKHAIRQKFQRASSGGQTPNVYAVGGGGKSGDNVDTFEIRIGSKNNGEPDNSVTSGPTDNDSLNNQAPEGMANPHAFTSFMQPNDVKYQVL